MPGKWSDPRALRGWLSVGCGAGLGTERVSVFLFQGVWVSLYTLLATYEEMDASSPLVGLAL